MHYCFLSTGSWQGNGTLPRTQHIGAALIERGVRVTYVIDDTEYNQNQVQFHPAAKRISVPPTKGFRQFGIRAELVRQARPDFLHCLASPKLWLVARLLRDIPIVCDWDEWPAIRESNGRIRGAVARHVDKWFRNHAVLRVVASRYMQARFRDDFGRDSVYIPHAAFSPEYPDGVNPFRSPTAVYMGSFYPDYDHDIVLEAAALLDRDGCSGKIEMIGGGPDLDKWLPRLQVSGIGNIALPGHMTGQELWTHLRYAHVLLFPLRDKPANASRCPGKIFYYAQARRPVICTRVGELPELLGDAPTYIPCTPEAFADAIRTALALPRAPDVEYPIGSWGDRADTLLAALKT